MRIVSDFHDYYDGIQRYGTDSELIFLRRMQRLSATSERAQAWGQPLTKWLELVRSARVRSSFLTRSEASACGGILMVGRHGYPFLEANLNDRDKETENVFLWTLDQAVQWFEKNDRPLSVEHGSSAQRLPELRRVEALFAAGPVDCSQALALSGAPLAILRAEPDHWSSRHGSASIELNPRLQATGFAAQMDAWTIFQQIAEFLGGVMLRPDPPMVAISDQSKAKKHGFDNASFRRPAGLPKRRKQKDATAG